ncbi:hypothetical protein KAR91_47690 [Candidatus Pacearchaeota archaeon]|nr:hypothetical protein [Candidatus Pacearchaeota archaeon]
MSKFTKQITKTYEFEGDNVVVKMKRLKRKDAIKLAPFMTEPDEDGKVKMKFEESLNFMEESCKVLMKYVTSFTGLTDNEDKDLVEGEPVYMTAKEVLGEDGSTYFMNLISLMISDLMQASFAGGDKEKKSLDVQQEDISKESVTIEHTSEE